jgi:hypothetical protein
VTVEAAVKVEVRDVLLNSVHGCQECIPAVGPRFEEAGEISRESGFVLGVEVGWYSTMQI